MPKNLETGSAERQRVELAAAQLSAIVEFSDDAIIGMDLRGSVTTWNGGAERLFGYMAGEMLGQPILRLIPPERQSEEKEILGRISRGESVRNFDTRRLRKDGSLADISVTVSPVKDYTGNIIGASKVARDITGQKRVEDEIRQLNQELERRVRDRTAEFANALTIQRAILGSANYAIISTTPEGVVTTFNSTAERWLGYAATEIIGKLTPVFWHDADEMMARAKVLSRELGRMIEPGFESLTAKARLGKIDENEWTLIRKDGGRFPVTLSTTRLVDADGAIAGFLGVVADITERKQAEKELRGSLKEAYDLKVALDEHALVAVTDSQGKIIYVNDKFCAISKYSPEELLGQDHRIINSGFHPKEFFRDLRATIGQGDVWKGEIKNKAKDGSCYWVDTTIVPFLAENGAPLQYVAIRTDITARKQHEMELERLTVELQHALSEVKTLSGMLPICASCKKIRDDRGYWSKVETYIMLHSQASFTHGICPECAKKFMGDIGIMQKTP
jgi:PAS domain S-box-containing protein